MGRKPAGTATTTGAIRLELNYLLRSGYLQKGKGVTGVITWRRGGDQAGEIGIEGIMGAHEKYIRLRYTVTDYQGNRSPMDYMVTIRAVPSNLGRGEVLYFVCPMTFKLCRTLYMVHNSPIFAHRTYYGRSLCYPIQTSSQLSRFNDRYWSLERSLGKLQQGRPSYSYSGKVTRRRDRIERLQAKQDKADILRFTEGMPKSLARKINIETPVGVGIGADKSKQNKQSKL